MARAPKAKTEPDNGAHQPDPGLVAASVAEDTKAGYPGFLPPIVHCKDCVNWGRQWPDANAAECLLAKRWTSMPVITTDLQTCTKAVARDA